MDGGSTDPALRHLLQLEAVLRQQDEFDVIHFHTEFFHFPVCRQLVLPALTTMHGRLDLPSYDAFFRTFADLPVSSVSKSQQSPLPFANWRGVVHHGLPEHRLSLRGGGSYLAFLGRISPEKGVDRAIEIARRVGLPLKVAAKIDPSDRAYYDSVRPLFQNTLVEFIGEIGERAKQEFLGNAAALLFPISWPEPFGLVMIEAMACGTPVLAFRCGAVPEVIEDGLTGCLADDVDGAVAAMDRLLALDRRRCRATFEERFTAARMAGDYLALYTGLSPQEKASELAPVE